MRRRRLVGSLGVLLVTAGCSDRGTQALMGPSAAIAAAASGFSVAVTLRCGSNVTAGQIASLTVRDANGAILSSAAGPACDGQQKITGLAAKPARYEATIHVEHFDADGGGTADCPVNGPIPDHSSSCVAPGGTGKTFFGTLSVR